MRFLITILLLTATCFAKAQSPEKQKEIETSLELMDIRNMTAESMKSMMELFNPNRSLGFLGAVWQREIL